MPISRPDVEFVLPIVNQIDAKTIRVDRAFGNLLLLVKTKGRPVRATKKPTILIKNLAQEILSDQEHFSGLTDDQLELLGRWLESDFVDVVRTGRGGVRGEAILAGLKPLHLDVVKLRSPIHAKDYGASRFLYSVISKSPELLEILEKYFGVGSQNDHYDGSDLDIETLFLLRLLDRYSFDRHSLVVDQYYEPICAAETTIFVNDLQRIMLYKDYIPRRELIRYLITLISFHLAISMLKTFRVVNHLVETQEKCSYACSRSNSGAKGIPECCCRLDIFVDLTEQKDACFELAQQKFVQHYAEIARYIKNHMRLKKLSEFSEWLISRGYLKEEQKPKTILDLLRFETHPKIDGYFERRLEDLTKPEEGEMSLPQVEATTRLGMNALDTYIEILYSLRLNYHLKYHRNLLDSFGGKNLESGFLHAGKGRTGRRYYLGSELLEALVQVAVVDFSDKRGFYTRGITISDFVNWLKDRYGLLIDEYGLPVQSVEVAQAMHQNYHALKDRLRQLGFYTDISDASNAQLIQPRFRVSGFQG